MNKKEELIYLLNASENHYNKIEIKAAFFLNDNKYYLIKSVCLPLKETDSLNERVFDYGDLVFLECSFSKIETVNFIKELEEDHEAKLLSYAFTIPRGYFRELKEDSTAISQRFGGHSALSDAETKMLREKRSFPKSNFKQWPTQTFIFHLRPANELQSKYSNLSDMPIPLKRDLPVLPDYYSALNWWFDSELRQINQKIIFYVPNYCSRILQVKFSTDSFHIDIEEGTLTKNQLGCKYYINYNSFQPDVGDIDLTNDNRIPVQDAINRLYVVLYELANPSNLIDYRNYHFGLSHYYDKEDFDIEYEEENIEYWLSAGENEVIEYKLQLDEKKPDEFIESVCSFSNTGGGRIFVGVDDNANVKGLDETQIAKYHQRIPDWIGNWIEPQVQIKIEVIEVRTKKILIVNIPDGDNRPYNYKEHGVYIRANKTDRIASREELISLTNKANTNLWPRQ